MGRGYNKNSVLYSGRFRWWKYFYSFFLHFTSVNSMYKRTVLGRKHVIWAIQRNDQCDGLWYCYTSVLQTRLQLRLLLWCTYLRIRRSLTLVHHIQCTGNIWEPGMNVWTPTVAPASAALTSSCSYSSYMTHTSLSQEFVQQIRNWSSNILVVSVHTSRYL